MKIKTRNLAFLGLLIYLCGDYLGNVESIICTIVFIGLSIFQFRLRAGNKYAKYQLAFLIYLCVSFFWAHKGLLNTTIATLEVTSALSITYCAFFLFAFIRDKEDLIKVIHVILASLTFLVVYLIFNTPLSVWGTMNLGQNLGINKNTIGMNLAWGCILCFYFIRDKKRKHFGYILLFALFAVISLLSGSRKGLLILVGGIMLYFVLCERNIKAVRNIFIAIIGVVFVFVLIMNVPVLYEQLGERTLTMLRTLTSSSTVSIAEDKSVWERSFYRGYAMQMFSENPFSVIFGHGLDGFRTRMAEIGYSHVSYSHCNYTELLANYGIIGFLLFYIYKVKLVIKTFLYKKRAKLTTLFMIIIAIGIIMDYGLVSYYDNFMQFCYVLGFCAIVKIPDTEGNYIKI